MSKLFNYGIGIHLLESDKNIPEKKGKINPKDNHISFQCSDMGMVMQKLEEMKIEYVTAKVEEGGVIVDQLFFHDPDGYMVEICNCQNLPVLPISSCPIKLITNTNANHTSSSSSSFYGRGTETRDELLWRSCDADDGRLGDGRHEHFHVPSKTIETCRAMKHN
ncbi:Lactoylglutathione lyase / glyoxalase I family protein [Prunus dulcis]|uniref:Lactoylglutathione lyase / glyoxalase I family protein n=1 Tax=Prunus dulcis TaxID=3755 RepID=A0A4Y1QWE2_PRUDU|nr:Lactoylglutathione lyase / glyoxalase I family protein [Prunus dulcis]